MVWARKGRVANCFGDNTESRKKETSQVATAAELLPGETWRERRKRYGSGDLKQIPIACDEHVGPHDLQIMVAVTATNPEPRLAEFVRQ